MRITLMVAFAAGRLGVLELRRVSTNSPILLNSQQRKQIREIKRKL
jgi:hypothetical protein